jgi:hypothetical protein
VKSPKVPPEVKRDEGFTFSVTMSPRAIRYASRLLMIAAAIVVCWYAPDAAVLAAKVKALLEAVKLLK